MGSAEKARAVLDAVAGDLADGARLTVVERIALGDAYARLALAEALGVDARRDAWAGCLAGTPSPERTE